MSPSIRRIIGIIFVAAAALLMILNLKRVADMGTFWVGLPIFIVGLVLLARSRKAR
jgi:hypothetical protein